MTDNVTPIFGSGTAASSPLAATIQPAKSYNIKIKEGPLFESQLGYLSVNGLFLVLTDTPNDPMTINFYALLEDVQYAVESDEVVEDNQETLPF